MVSDTNMTTDNTSMGFLWTFFFPPKPLFKLCFFTRMALHHSLGTRDARLLRGQLMASVFSMKITTFIGISKGKSAVKKLRKPALKNHFLALFIQSLRVCLNGWGETLPVPGKPFALHTPVTSLVSSLLTCFPGEMRVFWALGSLVSLLNHLHLRGYSSVLSTLTLFTLLDIYLLHARLRTWYG